MIKGLITFFLCHWRLVLCKFKSRGLHLCGGVCIVLLAESLGGGWLGGGWLGGGSYT
jgi:hypothetical protein